MNVLFITLYDISSIEDHGIYEDLLRKFISNGHDVYIISPSERRNRQKTHIIENTKCHLLKVKTGNVQKTNLIEKGISTLMLEPQLLSALKKYFSDVRFDLVLYSTPPITVAKCVEYVKRRDNAKTYLMLKDIFPQNAVDIGMMSKTGIKGILYKYFRRKEKKLYALSDVIGCMSQANVDYLLRQDPQIDPARVEICPNCVEAADMSVKAEDKYDMRRRYDIPADKIVFVYGGNLGKPQGIPFLIECLKSQKNNDEVFFLIVGSGTEFEKLELYVNESKQPNVKLMSRLPRDDYDAMVGSCDVGMIFLNHKFTIPNFPSRLLSYMQAKIPVLAVTDPNTDIGSVITEGRFGWWCESDSTDGFSQKILEACSADRETMGQNGRDYLYQNYTDEIGYQIINKHCL